MKKTISISVILFLINLTGFGQGFYHHPSAWMLPAPGPEKYYLDSLKRAEGEHSFLPRIHYNLSMGASFSSGGWYGNNFQTWVAPEIQYRVNEKLNVHAGVVVSRNFPGNDQYNGRDNYLFNSEKNTGYLLYAGADYKLNEQVIISADMVKSIGSRSPYNYLMPGNSDYEHYSFSVHYKLGRSMTLGANVQFINGNPPFGYRSNVPYSYFDQPFTRYPFGF